MNIIRFENVTKSFGGYAVLRNINLSIEAGEFVSIIGPSGAGKSTLLKLIYAEESPTEGYVYFKNRPINSIKKRLLPYYRRNIGTVFQDFRLLPRKTVYENVAYALEVVGDSNSEIGDKVPRILEIVGLLDKKDLFPQQLSGGEQQKISLARAMIHNPLVIVADEPTGNLDPVSSLEITRLLLKINKLGTTVVLATHDKSVVDSLKRRVVLIEHGEVVRDQKVSGYNMV